jgi:CRISPR-associated protein Csy3
MAEKKLKTASVLAFERKLDPSDAVFSAGLWNNRSQGQDWPHVHVREKSIRGTISNRLKTKDQDPAKLDAQIQSPNLQTVDVAALPAESDTLRVGFTVRVLSGVGVPSACNDKAYEEKLKAVVVKYAEEQGFDVLARRYAENIANGRFLWRNRLIAEDIEVQVSRMKGGQAVSQWTFDASDFSLRQFDARSSQLDELTACIKDGLAGNDYTLLEIVAYARVGKGQEIFPSQELILDKDNNKRKKSKTLYVVEDAAGMHSQKIGNALRTIDTWYPGGEGLGPIAIEPYGSVTSRGTAYRQPKDKKDFYNLLDPWVLEDEEPPVDQQHYVMAVFVRGGVFGEPEKE